MLSVRRYAAAPFAVAQHRVAFDRRTMAASFLCCCGVKAVVLMKTGRKFRWMVKGARAHPSLAIKLPKLEYAKRWLIEK